MIRRLLGDRPIAKALAASVCGSIGFALAIAVYHAGFYVDAERQLHRAEARIAELERESDKVIAARDQVGKIREQILACRTEIRRLERILPTAIDVDVEARAILDRIEHLPLMTTVTPFGEKKDRGFYWEYDFYLSFDELTAEELYLATDLIHRSLPMRTVTGATLPLGRERALPISVTITSYVYKTE